MRLLLLSIIFFLASCGGAIEMKDVQAKDGPDSCFPPGISGQFRSWRSQAAIVVLLDTSGVWVSAVRAMYVDGIRSVVGVWLNRKLIIFDISPQDAEVPVYYRTGYVIETGDSSVRVRTDPEDKCEWKRIKARSTLEVEA